MFASQSFVAGDVDDVFSTQTVSETPSPPPIYSGGFSDFSPEQNGKDFDGSFGRIGRPDLASAVGDAVGGGLYSEREIEHSA